MILFPPCPCVFSSSVQSESGCANTVSAAPCQAEPQQYEAQFARLRNFLTGECRPARASTGRAVRRRGRGWLYTALAARFVVCWGSEGGTLRREACGAPALHHSAVAMTLMRVETRKLSEPCGDASFRRRV